MSHFLVVARDGIQSYFGPDTVRLGRQLADSCLCRKCPLNMCTACVLKCRHIYLMEFCMIVFMLFHPTVSAKMLRYWAVRQPHSSVYFYRESEGICFYWRWFVCLCVCLSVTTITKKVVDEFVPNFMGRFLGGKGRPSSCFVTIGRGMWK